jgi:hypothetical protein
MQWQKTGNRVDIKPYSDGGFEMSTADDLFNDAFSSTRDKRSPEYKRGVLDALKFRLKESPELKCPYHSGIAGADAWHSGTDEGKWRAREYFQALAEEKGDIPAAFEVESKPVTERAQIIADYINSQFGEAGRKNNSYETLQAMMLAMMLVSGDPLKAVAHMRRLSTGG